MGKVVCEKHGAHVGTLCCDHVREGAQRWSNFEAPTTVRVDWLEDGSEIYDTLICNDCARRFGLLASRQVSGNQVEDPSNFPRVCPTCPRCLAEWQTSATP